MKRCARLLVAVTLMLLGVGMPGGSRFLADQAWSDGPLLLQAPAGPTDPPTDAAPAPSAPAPTLPAAPSTAPAATAATSPAPPALPALSAAIASGANLAVIRVDGIIDNYSLDSLKAMTDRAVKGGATIVVYEIQTPGGLRDVALKISKEIKNVPVTKIAWVNRDAYSAGAIIATACDRIVMAPAAAIGDAAPILANRSLDATERAKALSPILAEFRDSARRHGYDFALLHAMASLGVEVYLIENPDTGERRCVNQSDMRVMVKGETLEAVQGPGAPAALAPGQEPVDAAGIDLATNAQRGQWRLIRRVHDGQSLLTLNQSEAIETGLARKIVKDDLDLQQYLQAKNLVRLEPGWLEGAARVLSLPPVRFLLVLVLLAGIFMEMQAPGTLFGAIIALLALTILIVAPLWVGLAQLWHIALFLVGLILLVLELVPPPTFGLLAILGLLMMFVGLTLSVVPASGQGPFNLPASEAMSRLQQSILWTLIAYLTATLGLVFALRHFGRLPLVDALVHKESGLTLSGPADAPLSGDEALGAGRIAVGDAGSALSELRPSGRAMIQGQIVDVMTPGNWLPQGAPVRVIEVAGNRIVVDKA